MPDLKDKGSAVILQVKYYNAENYEVSRFEDAILKYQVSPSWLHFVMLFKISPTCQRGSGPVSTAQIVINTKLLSLCMQIRLLAVSFCFTTKKQRVYFIGI